MSACRSGRCTTSPSTTACLIGSTATGRTTGRCAVRAPSPFKWPACRRTVRRRRVAGAAVSVDAVVAVGTAVGARNRRMRVRLHDTGPGQSRRHLGELLWQRGHALRRPHAPCAVGEPVDPYAGLGADEDKYRCHWTPPLAFDPFEPETVYYGCQVIFKTSTQGQTWDVISPDLSTQDPSRIVFSGGVVGDNLGQFYGGARLRHRALEDSAWADLGRHQRRQDLEHARRRKELERPDENVKGMAPWGTITKIEPSSFDAGTAYVVVDYHLMDNRDPHIYKTSDFGSSWTKISDGLPRGPLAYALSVAENPNRQGMLFAGTGNGFHYSPDDGKSWKPFKTGLPAAPVTWIEVQKRAPRRRRVDLRPGAVHPPRHHDAGARRSDVRRRRASSTRRATACARREAAAPTSSTQCLKG